MILGVIVFVLVGVIAYFHYVQGLFSATISAICAMLAAVIAVSYHENVISALLKGAMAGYAEAMILIAMFALIYVILRVIFDNLIPGNVRYPLLVDKVGAAVMGVIAGLFAIGTFALAVQMLPFGPSVGMYARFAVASRPVTFPGPGGRGQDGMTFDEMHDTSFDPAKASNLFVPADSFVIGVVNALSSGALSNDHPLAAIHPDWQTELFGQRAGVQVGTKHVAYNLPGLENVTLGDLFRAPDNSVQIDGEFKSMRDTVLAPIKLNPAEMFLVVRIHFTQDATDEDGKVRVSCGAVRLVGFHSSGGTTTYTDYTPVGTLEDANALFLNKPDDPLIVNGNKSVDFVFVVPNEKDPDRDDILKPAAKGADLEIKSGVFLEVKRMAILDLGGKTIKGQPTYTKDVEVIRKPLDQAQHLPRRSESGELHAVADTSAGPLAISTMEVSDKIFAPINTGNYDGDPANVVFSSGNATMHQKKFQKLTVNTSETIAKLGMGDFANSSLFVPDDKKIVQAVGKPPPGTDDAWAWTDLSKFELVDSSGNKYKPHGAFAQINKTGTSRMVASFDADNEVSSLPKEEGRPGQVHLAFVVPAGTKITQVFYDGKPIFSKDVIAQ